MQFYRKVEVSAALNHLIQIILSHLEKDRLDLLKGKDISHIKKTFK